MATGALTLALLTLATGAVPTDVVPMNSRNFQIPIHIAEGQQGKIKELILFASSDQGQTWNEAAVAPPDKDAFIFYAPADGLYWFNICVVDAQGRREPPDIYRSAPRQKVLVDTLQPNVRIVSAERQGDEVTVAWEIQEEHPDLATLKLEQRTSDGPNWMWTPVSINPALNGQARFRVATFGSVVVHLHMADEAGNVGEAQTEVRAKPGAMTASPAAVVPAGLQSYPSTSVTSPASGASSGNPWTPPSANGMGVSPNRTAPPPASGSSWQTPQPAQSSLPAYAPREPQRSWPSPSAPGYPQTGGYAADAGNRYALATANTGSTYAPIAPTAAPRGPGDAPAPQEITNSTQVTLNYEVTHKGPSGVKKVELYITKDEGRNWQHYGEDSTARPQMTVNLPGEGVYGLRLVLTSGAGLARKAPQPGDLPQMRVEVDTTPPAVRLFPTQPDPTRPGTVLLTWSASDRNLAANPITLLYAVRPDGPWQTIAKELPNTGRYEWLLPSNPPPSVYLKVVAIDAAGNEGTDQTPDAVLIDPVEPEGQITGIIKSARRP
jgi:hypothetical protein